METQNITLSIPKETLYKVKLLAVKQGTSVSGLLTRTIERLIEQEDVYIRHDSAFCNCSNEALTWVLMARS